MRNGLQFCLLLLLLLSGAIVFAAEKPAFEEFTEQNKIATDRAMKWLLKNQNRDGSWGLDPGEKGDLSCTALCGMVLLSAGSFEREGQTPEHVRALRMATDYVLQAARKARGDISPDQSTLIQGKLGQRVHNFFAVIFLSQVYGMRAVEFSDGERSEMKDVIEKLADIIARTQEADGSWHKETFGSLKATCMAWLALRAAAETGVPIRHAAVEKTVKFIKAQYNPGTKIFDKGGLGGYQALYATASCLRVLIGMGEGPEKRTQESVDAFIQKTSAGEWAQMYLTVEGEDFLSATVMTHALIDQDIERWQKWFSFIGPALCKRQNADGTWITTACIRGRVFPTACALLTLQAPIRYLPIQQ